MTDRTECEVYSRVVGYLRPVSQYNIGKKQEFKDRKNFKLTKNDKLICPICKQKMIIYMNTPVCTKCDSTTITDLTWCKKHLEEKNI